MITYKRILELALEQAKTNHILAKQVYQENSKYLSYAKKLVDAEFEEHDLAGLLENQTDYEKISEQKKAVHINSW